MALRPRSNPFAILTALLLVLFLTTLAFNLLTAQRIPTAPGGVDVHAATELLLKVLGGIILLVLLYAGFARIVRRDSSPSTGFVKDNVFLDVEEDIVFHEPDRKSTRLNSSHGYISYAVFCL